MAAKFNAPLGYRRDGRPIYLIRGGAPRRSEILGNRLTEIKAETEKWAKVIKAMGLKLG